MRPNLDREFAKFAAHCEGWRPRFGLVLGSGLGQLVDRFEVLDEIPYTNVGGMAASTVPGHAGRFVRVKIGSVETIIAQGRVHLYEGHSGRRSTAHIRAMASLGVETILLTNAAGAINRDFSLSWMAITDHLNLTGASPLTGSSRFCDMGEAYDPMLRALLLRVAREQGIDVAEGVYAGMPGPQYETPAEVRMLALLGADAVGMSTVLETIQARALWMRVIGLSYLTNWAAGLSDNILDHEDVMARGKAAVTQLERLLVALAGHLPK
jgi:inosine/guanosine/xanthosine phosphorylase family protein